jgi:hypothetical protein
MHIGCWLFTSMMVWEPTKWRKALETDYVRGMPKDVLTKRIQLIDEAISWEGTIESPKKHVVYSEPNGITILFEKPGKEAVAGTNVNDMRPTIVINGRTLEPPSFTFIWSDLTNIAVEDFEAFKAVLLLIYRDAFLLDHVKKGDGMGWRYAPSESIEKCILELDNAVGSRTEFGSVSGLLRFIDLLGWNEDVKYHSVNGHGSFTEGKYGGRGKERIGRINTLLSCMRVPFEMSEFMIDYRREVNGGGKANFVPLYEIMQALINSRGLCTPKRADDLFRFLNPYLVETSGITIGRKAKAERPMGQRTID